MTTIKKHDFVEITYTGTLKEGGSVFDTTDLEVAKKHNIHREGEHFKPLTVCIGEHFLLKGIDDFLVGKESGKDYSIDLSAESAFGKKDPKLIQMIPLSKFHEHKINPVPGLQLNIDGSIGNVKTVSGGRVMVDFNHPLAGKELHYSLKVLTIITDEKKKVDAYLKHLGLGNLQITTEAGVVTIALNTEVDPSVEKEFGRKLKDVIPTLKEVKFSVVKEGKGASSHDPHQCNDPTHDHLSHSHSHKNETKKKSH